MKELWSKLGNNFKTNTTAFIAVLLGLIFVTFLILPTEKKYNKDISTRYEQLAQNYNEDTKRYDDLSSALRLKQEITDLQATSKTTKLFGVIVTSLILTGLVGMLGTLLQYIYTSLPFVKKKFAGEDGVFSDAERQNSMPVLASALLCSTIIVVAAYYINFTGV